MNGATQLKLHHIQRDKCLPVYTSTNFSLKKMFIGLLRASQLKEKGTAKL